MTVDSIASSATAKRSVPQALRGTVFTEATSVEITSATDLRDQLQDPAAFAFVELSGANADVLPEVSVALGDPELLRHVAPASGRAVVTQVNDDVMLSARLLNFYAETLTLSVSNLRVHVLPTRADPRA